MKDKYSQESKDDFDSSSHDSLVAFLRQNKAIAPPPAPNFEQQLFAEISKYPQQSSKNLSKFRSRRWLPWTLLIPAAIATNLTFNWVTNRSQLQVATNPNLAPMSESEQIAIEQTLISSWNVTSDAVSTTNSQVSSPLNSQNSTSDLQILSELSPLEY
jgi:hypothetical protein